jgi:hypothetical protein
MSFKYNVGMEMFSTITLKKCHQQLLEGWERRKKSHYTNKPQLKFRQINWEFLAKKHILDNT